MTYITDQVDRCCKVDVCIVTTVPLFHTTLQSLISFPHLLLFDKSVLEVPTGFAYAWAQTSVAVEVAKGQYGFAIGTTTANIVVVLKEHIVQVNHLSQNSGLLLGGYILCVKLDVEQVAVRKKLADALSHCPGSQLGDGGKVSKVGLVDSFRIVLHVGCDLGKPKDGLNTELGQSSGAAGPTGRRKELCLAGRVVGIGTFHHLHDGLEAAAAVGLDGFSQQLGTLPPSLLISGSAAEVPGVEGSVLDATIHTGEASDAGLGAGSPAIASLALKGHEGGSTGFVGPIDLLSGLELGGVLANEVKLDKDGVAGCAATTG